MACERYSRNIPSITDSEQAILKSKRVAVIGCGGLGAYAIEMLARIGVGFIRAVDYDVFEESNLNRQLFCTLSSLRKSKAKTAAERIREINSETEAEALECFLTSENAERLIGDCDVVIDALDSVEARRILSSACSAQKKPLIYGAVKGWLAQAAIIMPGEKLIDMLYPRSVQESKTSVLSFTVSMCASMQLALCTKLLTGREVESGRLYIADLEDMNLTELGG